MEFFYSCKPNLNFLSIIKKCFLTNVQSKFMIDTLVDICLTSLQLFNIKDLYLFTLFNILHAGSLKVHWYFFVKLSKQKDICLGQGVLNRFFFNGQNFEEKMVKFSKMKLSSVHYIFNDMTYKYKVMKNIFQIAKSVPRNTMPKIIAIWNLHYIIVYLLL